MNQRFIISGHQNVSVGMGPSRPTYPGYYNFVLTRDILTPTCQAMVTLGKYFPPTLRNIYENICTVNICRGSARPQCGAEVRAGLRPGVAGVWRP